MHCKRVFYYIQTPIVTFLATFYPPSTQKLSRSNELVNRGFINVGIVFINLVTETSITLLQVIIRVVFSNLDLISLLSKGNLSQVQISDNHNTHFENGTIL